MNGKQPNKLVNQDQAPRSWQAPAIYPIPKEDPLGKKTTKASEGTSGKLSWGPS